MKKRRHEHLCVPGGLRHKYVADVSWRHHGHHSRCYQGAVCGCSRIRLRPGNVEQSFQHWISKDVGEWRHHGLPSIPRDIPAVG
ncbi:uncharacterized protein LOC144128237 isoform X3 [Amblyomma americanum]